MTMYPELDGWQDPALTLPVRGTLYRIPAPTASEGLRLMRLATDSERGLSGADEIDEIARILGATWDEKKGRYRGGVWSQMESDGLTWPELLHAGQTALVHFTLGSNAALVHWESRSEKAEPESGKASLPDASAEGSAEESSPAPPAPTVPTTPAAGRGKKRRKSDAGTSRPQ